MGGRTQNVHMVLRGGSVNVHVCPQGGEGGSKMSKKLSTWFMNAPQLLVTLPHHRCCRRTGVSQLTPVTVQPQLRRAGTQLWLHCDRRVRRQPRRRGSVTNYWHLADTCSAAFWRQNGDFVYKPEWTLDTLGL